MKLFKIKYFAILAFTTAVVATGCKKAEFAINTNPDDVTASTVDYKSVLPPKGNTVPKINTMD